MKFRYLSLFLILMFSGNIPIAATLGERKTEDVQGLVATIAPVNSSCMVSVLDCGQGNAVVARYKTQAMVFDAGRTSASNFVRFEDVSAPDSKRGILYSLKTGGPLLHSYVTSKKRTPNLQKRIKMFIEPNLRRILKNVLREI